MRAQDTAYRTLPVSRRRRLAHGLYATLPRHTGIYQPLTGRMGWRGARSCASTANGLRRHGLEVALGNIGSPVCCMQDMCTSCKMQKLDREQYRIEPTRVTSCVIERGAGDSSS